ALGLFRTQSQGGRSLQGQEEPGSAHGCGKSAGRLRLSLELSGPPRLGLRVWRRLCPYRRLSHSLVSPQRYRQGHRLRMPQPRSAEFARQI
ncbi:uncharacterized protein METZ01_LOCUS496589, partial [marine metagenome]